MPLLMRRVVFRTGLAATGTLASVLIARNWWPLLFAADGAPEEARAPDAPPSLRDVADALVAVKPPMPLAPFTVISAASGGGPGPTRTVSAWYGPSGTVLNFWATWCGPCRREMGALADLARAGRSAGIAVVPVSIDRGGVEAVRGFFAANGVTGLPVVASADGAAPASLGLGAIPVTLVLDRRGRVVGRLDGAADWSRPGALAAIRTLLADS